MEKRFFREDEKKNQVGTQDCQRSIPSILNPWHSEKRSTLQKFKVLDFRDISVTLNASHRHSSSHDIISYFCQESKHRLFVIYCLTNVFQ